MNRTKKTFLNTIINILAMVVLGILTFARTAVIVSSYGSEINGIMQLSNQLFSYLVLLESGICGAYVLKFYKPVVKNERKKVASIFRGLTNSLQKIAVKMSIVMVVIAVVYPLFINKENVSYLQLIIILIILGIRFVLPYFLYVSKKNFLMAIEKRNIMDIVDTAEKIAIVILEIILMKVFKVRIELALSVGIIIILITNTIYNFILKKNYKEVLRKDIKPSYEANSMTKDVMVHQVSTLVYNASDSIVLSISSGLNYVTQYNAYYALISYVSTIIDKFALNIRVIFGLKNANNDKNMVEVFVRISILIFAFASIVTSTFYVMASHFVTLQIGSIYTLNSLCVILFSLILFSKMFMPIYESIRSAFGLYKESKKFVIIQAMLNLILSFILVVPFGISGVLIATIISLYFIYIPCNLLLIDKRVFKCRDIKAVKFIILSSLSTIVSILLSMTIFKFLSLDISWISFIIKTVITVLVSVIVNIIAFFLIKINLLKEVKTVVLKIIK